MVGSLSYLTLVLLLRSVNKRALTQLVAFDFIVTVAIGATFGRALTANKVALAEAITAFALLIFLHYGVAWLRMRLGQSSKVLPSPPSLLYFKGEFIQQAMRSEHITLYDLQSIVRRNGYDSFEPVEAIVIESNGKFSVISKANAIDGALTRQPEKVEIKKGAMLSPFRSSLCSQT